MFYNNSINLKDIKYEKKFYASFTGINSDKDENLLPIKSSPLSYNFDFSDGSLRDGMGVESLKFRSLNSDRDYYKPINNPPDDSFVMGCWLFTAWSTEFNIHRPFLILYTSKGEFYYNRIHSVTSELVKIEGLRFTQKPILASFNLNGEDTLILVSESDGMYIWQYPSIVRKIENAPPISSMCVHDDKLFVTTFGEKRKVWYSETLNPTAFTMDAITGGFFEMNDEFGCSNKVISFEGYLYVIRDFNIAKLVSYEGKEYKISQLYVSNGRIYENSVCVCGNQIVYLASDGIYRFDGNNAKKLELSINKLIEGVDNSDAVAGYSNGYYYLACRLNYGDNILIDNEVPEGYYTNNALIRINISTGEMTLMRGRDIIGVHVINDIFKSEVCVLVSEPNGHFNIGKLNMSGQYFNEQMTKVWNSPMSDFGCPDKEKLIKEISLETTQNIIIEIETENSIKEFEVKGRNGCQTIRPYVKGKRIAINFVSKAVNNYISNPCVLVGYL